MSENPKLIDKWSRDLPEPVRTILSSLVSRCETNRFPAYVVGGPVRDLVLGRQSLDIDIVVEGDAVALARAFENDAGVQVVAHPRFGTATLRLAGARIDVTTARSETYERPGALPRVSPGTIADDLTRRDFTINAMALPLTGRDELLDPHGGLVDLESRLIRGLHERSFEDDATRVIRAARYAARFGFAIEAETESWIRRDLGFLETISAARIHQEMARLFSEEVPETTLGQLEELGALCAIDPALQFSADAARAFSTLRQLTGHPSQATLWTLLLWDAAPSDLPRLARRFALTGTQRSALEGVPAARDALSRLTNASTSAMVDLLSPVPEATLWALAAVSVEKPRDIIVDFLDRLRHVRPILRGDAVIGLGVPRGPAVAEALRQIKAAKLNGLARTRSDEERIVREYLQESPR